MSPSADTTTKWRLDALLNPPRSWLPELRLSQYLLSPRLVHRGDVLRLQGRRIPVRLLFVFQPVGFCLMAVSAMSHRHGIPTVWWRALGLLGGALVLTLLLTLLTRIRIDFDGFQRTVRVERHCLWFWSKSETFSFDALRALEIGEAERLVRYGLVVSSSDGQKALLGRFRPAEAVIDIKRDLNAIVFGQDEVVRELRRGLPA